MQHTPRPLRKITCWETDLDNNPTNTPERILLARSRRDALRHLQAGIGGALSGDGLCLTIMETKTRWFAV